MKWELAKATKRELQIYAEAKDDELSRANLRIIDLTAELRITKQNHADVKDALNMNVTVLVDERDRLERLIRAYQDVLVSMIVSASGGTLSREKV